MNKWLKRLKEHWKDKIFCSKTGLKLKDLCVHDYDEIHYLSWPPQKKCKKCGVFISNKKELENDEY